VVIRTTVEQKKNEMLLSMFPKWNPEETGRLEVELKLDEIAFKYDDDGPIRHRLPPSRRELEVEFFIRNSRKITEFKIDDKVFAATDPWVLGSGFHVIAASEKLGKPAEVVDISGSLW